MNRHFRTCNLCEAMCGLAIEIADGRISSIRGDSDDPFSRGHVCPKAVALQDVHDDPDRLRRPLKRRGMSWEEIGWDEALDEAAGRLAAAKGRHGLASRLTHAVLRRLGPHGIVDLLLRFGTYGGRLGLGGMSLRRLRSSPHGIDIGPLEPCLPERLFTPGKRIALAPRLFVADLARLPDAKPDANGLRLIGRRDLRSNNSRMHNSARLVKGPERCTLLMRPQDAGPRGLADGQRVRVASRAGALVTVLELSDTMRPGVVSLPHGWGHHREGIRLRVASRRPGASLNDLTDEQAVDALAGTARLNGVPEVSAAVSA